MMDVGRLMEIVPCHVEIDLLCLVRDDPQALIVLLSEEIVVIDLVTDNWPMHHLPYLSSVHASPVICTTLVPHVHPEFYEKLLKDAALQFEDYSDRVRPLLEFIDSLESSTFRNGQSPVERSCSLWRRLGMNGSYCSRGQLNANENDRTESRIGMRMDRCSSGM